MTHTTTQPLGTIEHLLLVELQLLAADRTDTNVVECLRYARQLDDESLERPVAVKVERQLNMRLLALQHAYWRTPSLPPLLSKAMHERAAAVHTRLLEDRPSRPTGFSIAEREQAYLDGYERRAELAQMEASEALSDTDS